MISGTPFVDERNVTASTATASAEQVTSTERVKTVPGGQVAGETNGKKPESSEKPRDYKGLRPIIDEITRNSFGHLGSSPEESSSQQKIDLSQSFEPTDVPWLFDDVDLKNWYACLEGNCVLTLQSPLSTALISAATHIRNQMCRLGTNHCLNFKHAVMQSVTVDLLARQISKTDHKSLVVVFGYDGLSQPFLESLPEDSNTGLRNLLQERNAFILILLKPWQVEELPKYKGLRASRYLNTVPWLRPMLQAECSNEAANYEQRISALGSKWILEPKEVFDRVKNKELDATFRAFEQADTPLKTMIGLADGETIENIIKFTVCYFGGSRDTRFGLLSPDDFQYILLILFGEQTIDEPVQLVGDYSGPIPPPNKRGIRDLWKTGSQRIAEKCGVRVRRDSETKLPYIDFVDPITRIALVEQFETSYIWTYGELSALAERAGLLFDKRPSVRAGATKLILSKVVSDASGYGRGFITAVVDEAHVKVTESLPAHIREGLESLVDAASMKGLAEPLQSALRDFADSTSLYEAYLLATRFKSVPNLSIVFTDLLRRVLDELPMDREKAEMLDQVVNELLESLPDAPSSSVAAFKEMLSWGIKTQTGTAISTQDSSHSSSQQFAFSLLFRLHVHSPLTFELHEPAWHILLDKDFEKRFDATLPYVEDVVAFFVEWIAGPLQSPPEGSSLAIVIACLQSSFPKAITAEDTVNFLRAVFVSRWLPGPTAPKEMAEVQNLLRRLIPDRGHRQQILLALQVLADVAAAGSLKLESLPWNGSEQRTQRLQIHTRLREVCDLTRKARKTFSA